ncbi:putative secreted protein (Por secretion system target) [Winogradskyella pacifica]|uniref:Putative secreted protein (Por secretion system target) n=1 Tax=Winogradskyella pacifica TaxID=664642 RepID=A0A3D9MWI7_9FLAO|nr:T9SS type A sorting domain-containing protein [Winogradskyella pacifica]REE24355.1 putative secreted protein (Por secretion system target) [Winogradskyella pacifica]
MKNKITFVIAMAMTFFISADAFAQLVTSGADDGTDGTLRNEIADTPIGGVITFDTSVTTVTLNSELLIDKDLIISGNSITPLTIDANNNGRIFNITAGLVVLNDLMLINGLDVDGGAIYMTNSVVTINNSIISGNTANGASGSGGGIFNAIGGVLVVNNSEISNNTANRAGGGIEDNSGAGLSITLLNVNLDNNNAGVSPATAAPGNGGGLHITGAGSAIVNGGTVNGNVAGKEGGGLWNGSGVLDVIDVMITGNSAVGDATGGGGIYNNGNGTINISAGTTLVGNIASGSTPGGRGGAIFNNTGGILNLANGLAITGNYASRAGGAIEDSSNGTLILSGVTLTGNAAGVDIGLGNTITPNPGNGGAVHLSGTTNATISGFSTVSNNYAAKEGGGLWNNLGTMDVSLTFLDANIASGNDADDGGGAIFNNGGTLVVGNAAAITNNIANGTSGSGGGILSTDGAVTITDAVLAFNQSNRAGGAIEIIDGSIDFSGNYNVSGNNTGVSPAIASPGNGGGLHISGSGTAILTGGTMSDNVAAREGGALWNSTATMTVDGVLISGNVASGPAADDGGAGIFNNGGTLIVQNNTTISNNIADGASGSGGGILTIGGDVTVTNSTITMNQANRAGGGIEHAGGTLNLIDTTLDMNNAGVSPAMAAPGSGGGLHVSGAATTNITGGTTNNNIAANEGGGLWNGSGVMTIVNHMVDGNIASGNDATTAGAAGGGGVYNEGGTLDLSGTTEITNNIADGAQSTGGGILNAAGTLMANGITIAFNESNRAGGGIEINGSGPVLLTDVSLNNNITGVVTGTGAPGNGGGLHVSGDSTVDIVGGTVNGNNAAREGGGLWNGSGIMTTDNVLVDSNMALGAAADDGGAGIFNNGGTLNITNGSIISNNMATGASASGGGLLSTAGDVTVMDSTFDGNAANRAGGAIELIDGNLMFSNSIMSNNDVDGLAGTAAPGNGGGFHVTGMSGMITISTSTITGNAAANEGGGLWNQGGTMMTVSMSTVDNNTAAEGGGIYNNTGSITSVMTSTISGNSALVSGGGLTNNGASLDLNAVTVAKNSTDGIGGGIDAVNTVTLKNTIVALNTAVTGTDVSGMLTSNDFNLIGSDDLSVFTTQTNDIEGVDPLLGPLQDNGGVTLTHQLLTNSPAYDAGDATDMFVDQIGQVVFGGARDIGSVEAQVALSVDDFNAASVLNLYPNPTKGQFNIVIDNSVSGEIKAEVTALSGRIVKQIKIVNGTNSIDIRGISTGIYIVNVFTEQGRVSHKLILE